jgi:hypothetical protein
MSSESFMIPTQFTSIFASACEAMQNMHAVSRDHRHEIDQIFHAQEDVILSLMKLKPPRAHDDKLLRLAAPTMSLKIIKAFGPSAPKNYIVYEDENGMGRVAKKANATYLRALIDAGVDISPMIGSMLYGHRSDEDQAEVEKFILDNLDYFDAYEFLSRIDDKMIQRCPDTLTQILQYAKKTAWMNCTRYSKSPPYTSATTEP